MEQNYTPKPPRICPACGSAVADGFEACPTCGNPMPQPQSAPNPNPNPIPNPNPNPVQMPYQQGYAYNVPEGSIIVTDRKTYFEHYLPRKQYNNITSMAFLGQIIALLLGVLMLLGEANNAPVMLIIHTVISGVLSFWVLNKLDLASSIATLVYTILFFFISLSVFDYAFWYPIIIAVISLVAVSNSDKAWKAYQLMPVPLAILSDEEKKKATKSNRASRITVIVLSALLLVMSGLLVFMDIKENEQYENYTPGEISGKTYTNDFANITFTLPDGWNFLTEQELLDMNDELLGAAYDPDTYTALVSADNGNDSNFEYVTIWMTKYDRKAQAESALEDTKESIEFMYGDGAVCKILDDVTLNGVTYEVLYTVYTYTDGSASVSFDEYILIQTIGSMTFEIYIQPNADHSYQDILACFNP